MTQIAKRISFDFILKIEIEPWTSLKVLIYGMETDASVYRK